MPPFSYKSEDIGVAGRHTMNNNNNNNNNKITSGISGWQADCITKKGILVHVAMAG